MAAAQIFFCVFALMQFNVIDANPTVQADNHLLNLMELAKQLNLNTLVKALKPPNTWLDCGVSPICAITGIPRSVKNRMVSAIRAPPSSFTAPQPVSFMTWAAFRNATEGLSS